MCNMDCLNCKYQDCINDVITDAERKQQDEYDKESIKQRVKEERQSLRKGKLVQYDYLHSDKGKAAQRRYFQSDKGKAAQKKYIGSEKGKAAQKRYAQSEKGKEVAKKKSQKAIASGKNAEYCRAYYQRKKAERELMLCEV